MASKTFIQIPSDVQNPAILRRFLAELILRLDIAFGNRARSPFASTSSLASVAGAVSTVNDQVATLQTLLDVYTDGFNQPAEPNLNFGPAPDISPTYSESEVQLLANNIKVLADKVDDILAIMRNAKIISV